VSERSSKSRNGSDKAKSASSGGRGCFRRTARALSSSSVRDRSAGATSETNPTFPKINSVQERGQLCMTGNGEPTGATGEILLGGGGRTPQSLVEVYLNGGAIGPSYMFTQLTSATYTRKET